MTTDAFTERAFRAYVECALWSSTDDDGEPLDREYGPDDLADSALEDMRADLTDFVDGSSLLLGDTKLTAEQVGHDFWLTRNRHGAGFWDRGLGGIGDQLTAMSRPYGESYLYVGDDGLLYVG